MDRKNGGHFKRLEGCSWADEYAKLQLHKWK